MKNKCLITTVLLLFAFCSNSFSQPNYNYSKLKREKLGRGLTVIKKDAATNVVTWRYLSSDPLNVAFNVYRNDVKINEIPIEKATYFEDRFSSAEKQIYTVKLVKNGKEIDKLSQSYTLPANAPVGYIDIPLDLPQGGTDRNGREFSYSANDASVGDVDGDGEYEIILKWYPSNAKDNSQAGYTSDVFFDCYKLDGTKLWRINLGRNIRAGAHYTQFMVYDLDGDGKAEVVMKTADGTVDGKGKVIGDPNADYANERGFILDGPEFLTVFSGLTGEALHTIDYYPPRGGDGSGWGDNRGNRVDRHLACVAYLDGVNPSVVMCRGYYTRAALAAYDFKKGKLTQRWVFDSETPGNEGYSGQGNHNLRVGDVDGDGCDEIIYGSCAIDNDGKGLYTTGLRHGDAMHLTVFDPTRKGLQVWDCHENKKDGSTFRDAATGEVLFQITSPMDVGRCMAADIDPSHPGLEMWSSDSHGIRNVKGEVVNPSTRGVSTNMACWWDGDLLRELLDKNRITKYNYTNGESTTLLTAEGCTSNNGTKANPCLQADLLGDWREEVLLRTEDNKNLRLYVSTIDTDYRFHTFLEDPVYRLSIAYQNVAYNQPTQAGFYFGADLGNCFPDKELVASKSIVLDAGMDYDAYEWSVGGKKRTREITTKDIPAGKRTKIELKVTFRGYQFSDYVYVTLK
ncbi:rhamnogalacturonan lyase [Viscerimonas tarda]